MKQVARRMLFPIILAGVIASTTGCVSGFMGHAQLISTTNSTAALMVNDTNKLTYGEFLTGKFSMGGSIILSNQTSADGIVTAGDITTMLSVTLQDFETDQGGFNTATGSSVSGMDDSCMFSTLWYDVRAVLASTGHVSSYTQVGVGVTNISAVEESSTTVIESSTAFSARAALGLDFSLGKLSIFADIGLQTTDSPSLGSAYRANYSKGEPFTFSPINAGVTWRF